MSDAQVGVRTPHQAPPGADSEAYAKSSPPPANRTFEGRYVRAERYYLLSVARNLFFKEGIRQKLEYPNQIHATTKCKYIQVKAVKVMKSREHGKAFFTGLATCGSVWSCPACAAKIQERRRLEIAKAIDWAYENALQPVMVTLTFPHKSWDKVQDLLDRQKDALTRLRKGAAWDRFKKRTEYQGLIRALELTFGDNGAHPHTHELWFVSSMAEAEEMAVEVLKRWETACRAAGLLDDDSLAAFRKHAVDVKGWCSASDYLAKMDDAKHWGIDRELAKATSKSGRSKGLHAFGLLADAGEGDEKASRRFIEYSMAVKGRAQLFWSKGLKARVGVDEKTDEELAEEETETADLMGQLTADNWTLVRGAGAQAKMLEVCEDGGWPAMVDLLKLLAQLLPEARRRAYRDLSAEQESAKVLKTSELGGSRARSRTEGVELTP